LIGKALSVIIEEVMPVVGCRFVTTDAKTKAVGFYVKQRVLSLILMKIRKEKTQLCFLIYCLL